MAASPSVASEWCGVSRARFKGWMRSHDGLRTAVRQATAHLKVRLQTDLAKRSPEKALRRLNVYAEQADDGQRYSQAPRPYTLSGQTLVRKATPYLLARIVDENVPATDLTPLEVVAREMRQQIIADCDGIKAITTTKRHLIDSYIGIWIAASSLDVYIAEMGAREGLVSRKYRRAFPVIEQRARLADSLLRLAQAIGLDKAKPGATALWQHIEQTYGEKTNGAPASEPDPEPEITTEENHDDNERR